MQRVRVRTVGGASGRAAATSRRVRTSRKARRIYERLAGVPPSAAVLQKMANDIIGQPGQAGLVAAAAVATDPQYAPDFYDVTLKEFVNPWTNRNQSAFVPFNDYTATVIGMIRDDIPFNTVLSADILYTVETAPGLPAVVSGQ